jgi:hypothetical protein
LRNFCLKQQKLMVLRAIFRHFLVSHTSLNISSIWILPRALQATTSTNSTGTINDHSVALLMIKITFESRGTSHTTSLRS